MNRILVLACGSIFYLFVAISAYSSGGANPFIIALQGSGLSVSAQLGIYLGIMASPANFLLILSGKALFAFSTLAILFLLYCTTIGWKDVSQNTENA